MMTGKGLLQHVLDSHGLDKLTDVECDIDKILERECPWVQMAVFARALASRAHNLGFPIGEAVALLAGAHMIAQDRAEQVRLENAN
jgi:hypothetical protein